MTASPLALLSDTGTHLPSFMTMDTVLGLLGLQIFHSMALEYAQGPFDAVAFDGKHRFCNCHFSARSKWRQ